jgi:hypothetical protein
VLGKLAIENYASEGKLLRRLHRGFVSFPRFTEHCCDLCNFSEWLIENKYAARGKIAINGGSNGGMLA